MTGVSRKVALGAVAGVMTVGLLGSAALAAFSPTSYDAAAATQTGLDESGSPQDDRAGDKFKALLDGLVTKGVITQAQEDSILAAIKDTAKGKNGKGDTDKNGTTATARQIYADLIKESATYLGLDAAALKTKLLGTSLGALANATPGKSRDGLIIALTDAVNAGIAKAQADGKITTEQADKARTDAPEELVKFIDHKYAQLPAAATRSTKAPSVNAFIGDVFSVTRDYLALSQKDIMQGLRDGKSLGDIANGTPNKNRDGLVAALTNAADTKIGKAQTDGKITADQATDLKSRVGTAVTQLVDRKGHKGPKK